VKTRGSFSEAGGNAGFFIENSKATFKTNFYFIKKGRMEIGV
jgi:hypothetical protein